MGRLHGETRRACWTSRFRCKIFLGQVDRELEPKRPKTIFPHASTDALKLMLYPTSIRAELSSLHKWSKRMLIGGAKLTATLQQLLGIFQMCLNTEITLQISNLAIRCDDPYLVSDDQDRESGKKFSGLSRKVLAPLLIDRPQDGRKRPLRPPQRA